MALKKAASPLLTEKDILLPSRPRKIKGPHYYFRQAALSSDGSQIAFHFAGDIWLVNAEGGDARRLTSHHSDNICPIFSPKDDMLAFASARSRGGNIYLMSLKTQEAPRQLTFHNASIPPSSWSPDGKWLYFTSGYDGIGRAIYKINIHQGSPIKVHGNPYEGHHHPAVSPDGKWIAFNNNGQRWWRNGQNTSELSDIWLIPNETATTDAVKLNQYRGKNLNPMWAAGSNKLFFVSDRDGTENIWAMPVSGDGKLKKITRFRSGRLVRPAISGNGQWIVFERDFKLWLLNLETQKTAPVDIRVWVDEKNNSVYQYSTSREVEEFTLSPDGKKVGFITRGNIFADIAEKGKKTVNSFQVTNSFTRKRDIFWAPNSKNLIFITNENGEDQLFDYDFVKRKPVKLTRSSGQKHLPKISPDGKWLSYVYGDSEIRLIDGKTKEERIFIKNQVFLDLPFDVSYTWSPDSQWVAFAGWDNNYFCNIYVQNLSEEAPRQITFLSNIEAFNLLWSPDGKYLIFNTGHHRGDYEIARVDLQPILPTFKEDDFDKLFQESTKKKDKKKEKADESSEKNTKADAKTAEEKEKDADKAKKDKSVDIEFEDIQNRIRFLTKPEDFAIALGIRPNSKTLLYSARLLGKNHLWSMSMEAEKLGESPYRLSISPVYPSDLHFTSDGKKCFYRDRWQIYSMSLTDGGDRKSGPSVVPTLADVKINFHREKMHAFDEAWRLIRDYFYDENYHGCDWKKTYRTFYPVVKYSQTRREFWELLRMMVGELNASHLGASGWGYGNAPDSFLGVDFDPVVLEKEKALKIQYILPKGPMTLTKEPAKVGEYLVAIDGTLVNAVEQNLAEIMQRKSNRRLKLLVNDSPQAKGAREVIIKPITAGRYNRLRYKDWVRKNAAYVTEKSKGKMGYVHIESMYYRDYMKLIRDLDSEAHNRAGIIVDIRYNGGGYSAAFMLDVLYRKSFIQFSFRGRSQADGTNYAGNRIFEKPLVLITNEHSASNAEIFSEGFRRLGLGKIVGKPTAGAVISTRQVQLLDGTSFRLPSMLVTTMDGENTELSPRPVDIEVDRPLGEAAKGIDSQLDVAVETLSKQIKRSRKKRRS